jgi:ABC-type transport system involved in Fe-S cluster assembly fused permease/ATPase subunit
MWFYSLVFFLTLGEQVLCKFLHLGEEYKSINTVNILSESMLQLQMKMQEKSEPPSMSIDWKGIRCHYSLIHYMYNSNSPLP